jgi:hypothetical protein
MTKESLEAFGPSTAIGRAGQPVEVATAFVFLASADSSYFTAQVCYFFPVLPHLRYQLRSSAKQTRGPRLGEGKGKGRNLHAQLCRAWEGQQGAVRRTEDTSYKVLVEARSTEELSDLGPLGGVIGQMTTAASYFDHALTSSAST